MIVGQTKHAESPDDYAPLYPVEGLFLSVADKSFVLGLLEIDRIRVLAQRAENVLQRHQNLLQKSAWVSTLDEALNPHKKRKKESDIEHHAPQLEYTQQFTVHRDLLCTNSKFFKAACSKLWAEGSEKVVRLPEVKVDAFQAYLVWAYTGRVAVNKGAPRDELTATVDLYLLGDVLDDPSLRNAAMRSLVTSIPVWNVVPYLELVNHIWASTPTESRLRQVIIDVVVMRVGRDGLWSHVTVDHPKEYLHRIAVASLKQVSTVPVKVFLSGLDGCLELELSNNTEKSK